MKQKRLWCITLVGLQVLTTFALARQTSVELPHCEATNLSENLAYIDLNRDGRISVTEAVRYPPLLENFHLLDEDKNAYIAGDELRACAPLMAISRHRRAPVTNRQIGQL